MSPSRGLLAIEKHEAWNFIINLSIHIMPKGAGGWGVNLMPMRIGKHEANIINEANKTLRSNWISLT